MESSSIRAPEKSLQAEERRRFPRFGFSGPLALWVAGKRLEVSLVDVSQAAALVEAPVTFLRRINRLEGARCFSSSTLAHPIDSLQKDIERIEVRSHSDRMCRLVLHFSAG